jgi:hypothetical protein
MRFPSLFRLRLTESPEFRYVDVSYVKVSYVEVD